MRLYNGPILSQNEEAIIQLPEEFEVLELNGQVISDTRLRFRSGNVDLKLPAGEHVIVFQYKAFWQIDDDNHDILSSAPITFKLNMDKQEQFTFQLPDIKHYSAAVVFTKTPVFKLVSSRQSIKGSIGIKDNALVLTNNKAPTTTEYPNLTQLKFWWNRATYYEQSEFINWQKKAPQTSN
jgi:uncharacterized protein YccT (UPF0319 family)